MFSESTTKAIIYQVYDVDVYIQCQVRSDICRSMHRSIDGHNPYDQFILNIYYSKNFTTT